MKYTITYKGAVEVEADSEDQAIYRAWEVEAIHASDIVKIEKEE